MKKLFAWALVIVLSLGCAGMGSASGYEEEILFRDLPWMMDVETFTQTLADTLCENFTGESLPTVEIEESEYTLPTLTDQFSDDAFALGHGYDFDVNNFRDDVLVAGYPLMWIDGIALWGVSDGTILAEPSQSRVVRVRYHFYLGDENLDDVWADLQSKLTEAYGEEVITQNSPDDESLPEWRLVWYGANNTYVMLACQYVTREDRIDHIRIEYGRSDLENLLRELQGATLPTPTATPAPTKNTDGL